MIEITYQIVEDISPSLSMYNLNSDWCETDPVITYNLFNLGPCLTQQHPYMCNGVMEDQMFDIIGHQETFLTNVMVSLMLELESASG